MTSRGERRVGKWVKEKGSGWDRKEVDEEVGEAKEDKKRRRRMNEKKDKRAY